MGNICDCLNSSNVEQEYTPIETVEVAQPRDRPVQKSGNNYQSIIDRASGNFISSTYRSKTDNISINNQQDSQQIRSKFQHAEVNPQVISSPPTTGIVLQSYSTFGADPLSRNATTSGGNKRDSVDGKGAPVASPASVVSVLHQKPSECTALEKSADELAAIVMKQTGKNIDRFSNSSNEFSAVVGFKPFEGSIHTRQ
eukprot:CAMPEP_0184976376 /NCGR_PEP_ID=MMETSP1098-20130426/7345_1 /TAXON_ID=89044 /ORGANISM="Spumella elongata, Strain CCAP 955/1" /LENGTH=197 /DNA_ID=CAMNT_0027499237 /DNA_START=93 /DNA_END=686 /DNA_ORIENTATION=-